ncbi:MAG TPA: DUF2442 domain-containing protein [Terriglobia bacterium]|nr:DUF2442 domain-containing protein [Terriglobia bacterium]
MKSETLGRNTSAVEVTNISRHGFWLLVDERELFVPFEEFPWFSGAPVSAILKVERPHAEHLFWPDLDVDLAVASIEHPERFPLVSKIVTDPKH